MGTSSELAREAVTRSNSGTCVRSMILRLRAVGFGFVEGNFEWVNASCYRPVSLPGTIFMDTLAPGIRLQFGRQQPKYLFRQRDDPGC